MIEEFTRECIVLEVHRKLAGDHLVERLTDLFIIRGVLESIRNDNGPGIISHRAWQFLEKIDVGPSYIEPGSLWCNGYVESFQSHFRGECELFATLAEAREVIAVWRQAYDHRRLHSSLGDQPPADFASQWPASVPAARRQSTSIFTQTALS